MCHLLFSCHTSEVFISPELLWLSPFVILYCWILHSTFETCNHPAPMGKRSPETWMAVPPTSHSLKSHSYYLGQAEQKPSVWRFPSLKAWEDVPSSYQAFSFYLFLLYMGTSDSFHFRCFTCSLTPSSLLCMHDIPYRNFHLIDMGCHTCLLSFCLFLCVLVGNHLPWFLRWQGLISHQTETQSCVISQPMILAALPPFFSYRSRFFSPNRDLFHSCSARCCPKCVPGDLPKDSNADTSLKTFSDRPGFEGRFTVPRCSTLFFLFFLHPDQTHASDLRAPDSLVELEGLVLTTLAFFSFGHFSLLFHLSSELCVYWSLGTL